MFSMRSAAPTWSRFSLALVVAVWLATVGNISLWKNLDALPEVMGWRGLGFMVAFGVAIAAVAFSLLILCAWPVLLKGGRGGHADQCGGQLLFHAQLWHCHRRQHDGQRGRH